MAIMYVCIFHDIFGILNVNWSIFFSFSPSSFLQSGSCDSLFSKHDTRFTNSGESLSEGFGNSLEDDDASAKFSNGSVRQSQPQVPPLVTACIDHLTNFGLHVVGIFRVSTSKRRIREVWSFEHVSCKIFDWSLENPIESMNLPEIRSLFTVTRRTWLWFIKNIRFGN